MNHSNAEVDKDASLKIALGITAGVCNLLFDRLGHLVALKSSNKKLAGYANTY